MKVIPRKRLSPPFGLNAAEQFVWNEMVNSCDAEHFIPSDVPLMIGFCQSFVQQQRAMEGMKEHDMWILSDNGKVAAHPSIAIHKSLSGTLSNLAMRLRICPSTRIQQTNKKVGSDLLPGLETEGDDIDSLFAH
ncbi:MAG: hypothetical protein JRJ45_00655 [Deltaproteobacteria bacterium]|nr:hypothetical protein [Deltaproteobacteria bacterium]